MTPGLPFVPAIAITVNIYLILKLSKLTLVRFTIWMSLGFIMYFYYGIKNSTLEEHPDAEGNIELTVTDHEKNSFGNPSPYRPDQNIFQDQSTYSWNPSMSWDHTPSWAMQQQPQQPNTWGQPQYQVEQQYNVQTNNTSSAPGPTLFVNDPTAFPTWDD
ncbi:hypothetical protein D910_05356 [Dendroctonus ponderosae]|uniref:Cationic amino acid transporter C-terminal domain-containing protein n=1 Tax=Dendroctonus ponderosae TaxID=77166 RepID=U4U6M3_DENPD|nr:hypothetical protein D910_05356 [Dendroctonus ponderosae]